MARLDKACQVLYTWPWGNTWRRPRCELVPVTSVLPISLGTLLSYSLCFIYHITRVPLMSQSISLEVCQRGCVVQMMAVWE